MVVSLYHITLNDARFCRIPSSEPLFCRIAQLTVRAPLNAPRPSTAPHDRNKPFFDVPDLKLTIRLHPDLTLRYAYLPLTHNVPARPRVEQILLTASPVASDATVARNGANTERTSHREPPTDQMDAHTHQIAPRALVTLSGLELLRRLAHLRGMQRARAPRRVRRSAALRGRRRRRRRPRAASRRCRRRRLVDGCRRGPSRSSRAALKARCALPHVAGSPHACHASNSSILSAAIFSAFARSGARVLPILRQPRAHREYAHK